MKEEVNILKDDNSKLSRSQPEIPTFPTHYPQQPILPGAQAKIPGSMSCRGGR